MVADTAPLRLGRYGRFGRGEISVEVDPHIRLQPASGRLAGLFEPHPLLLIPLRPLGLNIIAAGVLIFSQSEVRPRS
jgi:hypothetical protein